MPAQSALLWHLLKERHWQTYGSFVREYKKAAQEVDPDLTKTPPSRAQFYRWLSGEIKGLPYADHCLVLEKMFPEWSVAQLVGPYLPGSETPTGRGEAVGARLDSAGHLFDVIDAGLVGLGLPTTDWGPPRPDSAYMPDGDAGRLLPARVSSHAHREVGEATRELGQRLLTLAKVRRLPATDTEQLARLAGNVVELDLTVNIDVGEDGHAGLTYRHELLNMSNRPLTKLVRELWFEHTTHRLAIDPVSEEGRHVAIQRIHDTASLAKFACQISPPIRPGEVGVVGYSCRGGQFLDDHYWRQEVHRYTRHFTIRLRHRGGGQLSVCTAVEGHPDGSENSATEDLMWDYEGDDVVITLTRNYLKPGQSVTLRWAVSNEPA